MLFTSFEKLFHLNYFCLKKFLSSFICNYFDLLSEKGEKNAALTNALLYMIAVDDMPLMTTEKRGFLKFAKVASSLYKPPSRTTITRLMDAKYKTLSDKLKADLKTTI